MDPARNGLWLSFLAGAATGLGGLIIVAVMDMSGQDTHRILSFALASAAGVMVSVSVADLFIPLVREDGLFLPLLAVLFGCGLFALLSAALSRTHLGKGALFSLFNLKKHHTFACAARALTHAAAAEPAHLLPFVSNDRNARSKDRNLRLAVLTFVALTLHNFPEGLAVSVSSTKSEHLGLQVAIAVVRVSAAGAVRLTPPVSRRAGHSQHARGHGHCCALVRGDAAQGQIHCGCVCERHVRTLGRTGRDVVAPTSLCRVAVARFLYVLPRAYARDQRPRRLAVRSRRHHDWGFLPGAAARGPSAVAQGQVARVCGVCDWLSGHAGDDYDCMMMLYRLRLHELHKLFPQPTHKG